MNWRDWDPGDRDVLYGPAGAEEDIEYYIDDAVRRLVEDGPGEPAPPYELHVYERRKLNEQDIRNMAGAMVDTWAECFVEEFGDPDGSPSTDEHGAVADELLPVLRVWAARSSPRICDPTGEVVEIDRSYFERTAEDTNE